MMRELRLSRLQNARWLQVAAGAVLGVVVGYLVGVSWANPLT